MKLDNKAFQKWEEWGHKMRDDLLDHLIHPRQLFRAFNEMTKANTDHIHAHNGGTFFKFVAQGYITQVAMTIRKHSKNDESISFMRLLEQLKTCAPQFTYDLYSMNNPVPEVYLGREGFYETLLRSTFNHFVEVGESSVSVEPISQPGVDATPAGPG